MRALGDVPYAVVTSSDENLEWRHTLTLNLLAEIVAKHQWEAISLCVQILSRNLAP
jgi:hypothetical protein